VIHNVDIPQIAPQNAKLRPHWWAGLSLRPRI